MQTHTIFNIKATHSEILAFHQFEVRHLDTACSRHLVIMVFLQPYIFRVIGMTELYQPVPINVMNDNLRTGATRIPTLKIQGIRILVCSL